jgi:hypothetical protein
MYPTLNENLAAAVKAQLRKTIIKSQAQHAVTKNSYKSGRGAAPEAGQLAGLEVPFQEGVVHGETALDPYNGGTSFERMYVPTTNKMYIGLAFMGFTVEFEHFHEKDAMNGNLPWGQSKMREDALMTYMQHQNWYRLGKGNGSLAVVSSVSGATVTMTNDGTARGRSKGSLRLAVSPFTTAGKRILYQSYNATTDALGATFYITAKSSATTATVVITDGGTITAGEIIVKYGHYKKVPYGHAYHFDSTGRLYQGVSTSAANAAFLNSRAIDGGAALVTPTVMDTLKGSLQTRANDVDARKKRVCHLTIGNYKALAGFGYALRTYNAEKGQADTTYGVPVNFEDEDTEFIQDADFEDNYIDLRDRVSYFEYRQSEMQEVSKGAEQYAGTNLVGSTEFSRNWCEAYNFAFDMRGDDGKGKQGAGAPNSSAYIYNLTAPSLTQVAEGISLV